MSVLIYGFYFNKSSMKKNVMETLATSIIEIPFWICKLNHLDQIGPWEPLHDCIKMEIELIY